MDYKTLIESVNEKRTNELDIAEVKINKEKFFIKAASEEEINTLKYIVSICNE